MTTRRFLVIGAGIFGTTSALALRRRGHTVTLMDEGPLPHPLAASTDISKVLRMEYGTDDTYMAMMEDAFDGWRRWARAWTGAGEDNLYHETGVLMVTRDAMRAGGFEHDSWETLNKRGHVPARMTADTLARRFPAWSTRRYVDGFFHAIGGYAESGHVVERLLRDARAAGVTLVERRMRDLVYDGPRVIGITDDLGDRHAADHVILAAGAWTGKLLGFAHEIRATAHPVLHLQPDDPSLFTPDRFPVFTADVARTGLYGFPLHRSGVVKVALHDPGHPIDPDAPRLVTVEQIDRFRTLLADTFPALADAPIVYSRLCLYADTQDEDFWIAPHPEREELTVASGGSGHGFKFAPMLGDLIADVAEGKPNAYAQKFRWRPEVRLSRGQEAARYHGD